MQISSWGRNSKRYANARITSKVARDTGKALTSSQLRPLGADSSGKDVHAAYAPSSRLPPQRQRFAAAAGQCFSTYVDFMHDSIAQTVGSGFGSPQRAVGATQKMAAWLRSIP